MNRYLQISLIITTIAGSVSNFLITMPSSEFKYDEKLRLRHALNNVTNTTRNTTKNPILLMQGFIASFLISHLNSNKHSNDSLSRTPNNTNRGFALTAAPILSDKLPKKDNNDSTDLSLLSAQGNFPSFRALLKKWKTNCDNVNQGLFTPTNRVAMLAGRIVYLPRQLKKAQAKVSQEAYDETCKSITIILQSMRAESMNLYSDLNVGRKYDAYSTYTCRRPLSSQLEISADAVAEYLVMWYDILQDELKSSPTSSKIEQQVNKFKEQVNGCNDIINKLIYSSS